MGPGGGYNSACNDCPCHQPTADWTKEFDEKFRQRMEEIARINWEPTINKDIKLYIISLVEKTKQEEKARVLQVLEEALPPERPEDRSYISASLMRNQGFNVCRNQILATLKEMKWYE